MAIPRSTCHLIFFLVLLSTAFSFTSATRLLERAVGSLHGGSSTRNAADHDSVDAASGFGHELNSWVPWGGENYCYPCANMAGIVLSLPGISLPGLALGLPPISIGSSGLQIGGYPEMIAYIPGYGYTTYTVCCIPLGGYIGRGRLFAAPPGTHSGQGKESKGHDKNKHAVNPKMEARKHGSEGYEVDRHVVKPKVHVGKQSSANDHGEGGCGEYKEAYTMPPLSS